MESDYPVYQLINGELVRKPNDERDPDKLYSLVCGEEQTYNREFTAGEERQREEDVRRWEAERPRREAEENARLEEAKRFRDSLVYEPRIVAFLDVLGWSAAIERSIAEPELVKQLGVAQQAISFHAAMLHWQREQGGANGWPGDPRASQFSDSVVLSYKADRHAQDGLLWSLHGIVQHLLHFGLFVRGAVVLDLMIHQEAIAYGPALVRAAALEKSARTPRILLDPKLASWGRGSEIVARQGELLGVRREWRQDSDGHLFFDFLKPWPDMTPDQLNAETVQAQLLPIRKIIQDRLQEYKDSPVLSKYIWLACYFNKVCAEHSYAIVPEIDLVGVCTE